jgi:predicted peroxiredoxin
MDKIINLLINNWTKGVDTYTHNGSTWLIFTEQKSWVIELTESKTLWYNYNFFKELFSLTSMDVVDNQHYITKWVEDNLINKVKDTILEKNITKGEVEGIIEMGVIQTNLANNRIIERVEDTIKNGVKETFNFDEKHSLSYEQGVKKLVEDTIKNGVRHTEIGWHQCNNIDEAIEKGVKETSLKRGTRPFMVNDTVKNGVKETKTPGKDGDIMSTVEWMMENNSTSYPKMIDDVIENGVKETFDTEFMPKAIVEDIIQNGVKETKVCHYTDPKTNIIHVRWPDKIVDVIQNGTKNPSV